MAYVDLKPIPIRERAAIMCVGAAQIDVSDQGLLLIDAEHGRTHVPIAGLTCLMLEPGTRISHAAIALPTLETDLADGWAEVHDLSFDWALNRDSYLALADIAISTIAANQATDDSDMNSTGPTVQQERHDGGLR